MSKFSDFLHHVSEVATLVEADAFTILKALVHLAERGAPIAEAVGAVLGEPEVVAGAKIADTVAHTVDAALNPAPVISAS